VKLVRVSEVGKKPENFDAVKHPHGRGTTIAFDASIAPPVVRNRHAALRHERSPRREISGT
jgi:hypothetical protein